MERRAVFVLLGLLYLAVGTLVTVQAVTYSGPTVVHEGQAWEIECNNLKAENGIRWTRNGQTLEPELSSGQLVVLSKAGTGTSKLSATQATESHDGDYKCTSDSAESFHLSIYIDIKIRVLTPKDIPLVLECANKSDKVQWQKEKTPLSTALAGNEDIIKIDNETGSLEIVKDKKEAYGNYTCKLGANSTIEYRVVPRPIAHLAESTSVVEGEKLHLVCAGKDPSPGVKISWTFGDQNYTRSKGRVKIAKDSETGIYGAVLIVDNIEMNDRGNIICRMSYNWSDPVAEHSSEAETFLRVKDKLAALWPFLGICVEVVVLCAIILVYEKKRNKAELEESDTDQSPDTKPTPNKESDVRQRK
ncbi:Basigin [Formica fusca]